MLVQPLGASAAQVAESSALGPQNRYGAPHKTVPAGVRLQSQVDSDTAATTSGTTFNPHVVLWTSFDVPESPCGTQPVAINDLGDITGTYYDANCNSHGFVRKADGSFVTFDAPKVGYPKSIDYPGTSPTDINNQGQTVGSYTDAKGATHGFVRSQWGHFTVVDDPKSNSSPPATYIQALNDWGVAVGYWIDSNNNPHGFLRHLDGSLTAVEPKGAILSQAYHINNLEEVGGDWADANFISHGMLRHPDGKLLTFEAPRALTTFGGLGQALNLEGSFAGTWLDGNTGAHGYIRFADGTFAEFRAPGGGDHDFNGTWSASLNSLGTAVGYSARPNGSTDGFVRFANGSLGLVDAPQAGQQSTLVWSVNDYNEITGFWFDAKGNEHGFVALAIP